MKNARLTKKSENRSHPPPEKINPSPMMKTVPSRVPVAALSTRVGGRRNTASHNDRLPCLRSSRCSKAIVGIRAVWETARRIWRSQRLRSNRGSGRERANCRKNFKIFFRLPFVATQFTAFAKLCRPLPTPPPGGVPGNYGQIQTYLFSPRFVFQAFPRLFQEKKDCLFLWPAPDRFPIPLFLMFPFSHFL